MPEAGTATREVEQLPPGEWLFELPSLGADMENGTVLEWYAEVGARLERGDLVALVSTEKADIDVEIWQPGIVLEQLVEVGREVSVGTPLLRLADPTTALRPEPSGSTIAPKPTPAARTTEPVAASPFARAMADERGLDLAAVTGTGPNGAVLARDLEGLTPIASPKKRLRTEETAPEPSPSTGQEGLTERASSMRQAIAERMAKANREIPHYHLELDVDLGPASDRLQRHNAARPVADRVLPAALLLKATAAAVAAVPELNGFWIENELVPADNVDLAVAVSLRNGGLVTPKIPDVDQLDLDAVMAKLAGLVAGARRGALRSSWMADAGLTVTILGDQGADRVNGVIFPPQVALVGFGRVTDRPWIVDGVVAVRPVITVSLAADHRASDGATGSRFLNRLADYLATWEEP